jgi:hypothetical protein
MHCIGRAGTAAVILALGAGALIRCTDDPLGPTVPGGTPPGYFAAQDYSAACPASSFDPAKSMHVTYPTGGEVFHIGDTVVIGVCYEQAEDIAGGEELHLTGPWRSYLEIVSFFDAVPAEVESGLHEGMYQWVIPAKLRGTDSQGLPDSLSVVGDSLRIRIMAYQSGPGKMDDYSYSGAFSIKAR